MKHLIALSLGTLALGIAEFGMMAILTPLALSLGVTIAELLRRAEAATDHPDEGRP